METQIWMLLGAFFVVGLVGICALISWGLRRDLPDPLPVATWTYETVTPSDPAAQAMTEIASWDAKYTDPPSDTKWPALKNYDALATSRISRKQFFPSELTRAIELAESSKAKPKTKNVRSHRWNRKGLRNGWTCKDCGEGYFSSVIASYCSAKPVKSKGAPKRKPSTRKKALRSKALRKGAK